jgi:hypothetical protein
MSSGFPLTTRQECMLAHALAMNGWLSAPLPETDRNDMSEMTDRMDPPLFARERVNGGRTERYRLTDEGVRAVELVTKR